MRQYRKIIKDASFYPLSSLEHIELNKMCEVAKRLDKRHAIPATSSNFSIRTKNVDHFLITKSGIHKRNLNSSQFIRTQLTGNAIHPLAPKPSDETLLHALVYKNLDYVNAVIHCHALEFEYIQLQKNCVNLDESKNCEKFGFYIFPGHELLKALGYKDHNTDYYLPVIKNNQDMEKVSQLIEEQFFSQQKKIPICAFLLENHGIYCFGNSVRQAELRLEALLHLSAYLK
ncbi:class II aldolase/adducin family protein [Pigmentibacter sp. JX0631]|uniref:class II aldolase/adducin family protein n=1 Tax=Pigmentibacter sp. JX0631 TaxID=2976982 RepID=UPI002468B60F|nr:class II aldolase/adducin family protein [Pigmentibacter sp. JX0631]WGL59012.1 class II aldolase/adducin family protein [Pigmentibacter sp. JX0631]